MVLCENCLALLLLSLGYISKASSEDEDVKPLAEKSDPVTTIVTPLGSGELYSVGYPTCCTRSRYLIEVDSSTISNFKFISSQKKWHIKVLFDDLDIPATSKILIYDGKDEKAVPFDSAPRFRNGQWTRPVYVSSNNVSSIYIIFEPGPVGNQRYVGFKTSFWADRTPDWTLDKPMTECPFIGDPMDGGMISLSKGERFTRIHYRYDCVWQLKVPTGVKGLNVYIRIDDLKLVVDGNVQIRNDIYSEAEPLAVFEEGDLPWASKGGSNLYTSDKGFYIRVQKPLDMDHVRFVYGVYKEITHDIGPTGCVMEYGEQTKKGFRCRQVPWCIPREHTCNTLVNCPGGADEEEEYCREKDRLETVTPTMQTLTTSHPCPFRCDDGSCVKSLHKCLTKCGSNARRCPDNSCVPTGGRCRGECKKIEKQCKAGECIPRYERCPEDPCPSYKPNKCQTGGDCYYDSEKCNTIFECPNGSDEQDWCVYNSDLKAFDWRALYALMAIPTGVFFYVLVKVVIKELRKPSLSSRGRDQYSIQQPLRVCLPLVSYPGLDPPPDGSSWAGLAPPYPGTPPGAHPRTPPPSYEEAIASAPPGARIELATNTQNTTSNPPGYEIVNQSPSQSPRRGLMRHQTSITTEV